MSDITREQYDNAVRIKNDGYSCRLQCPGCLGCPLQAVECGRSDEQGEGHNIRISAIDSVISTYEAEHPEEFRNMPDVGEGWRFLGGKELILNGDEVFRTDLDQWVASINVGLLVERSGQLYRRRISKPPRIYDYRDVDLPEVQALIGKKVYVSDYIFTMLTDPKPCHSKLDSCEVSTRPFVDSCGIRWQFIRAIDKPPKIKITRAELIAIAAKDRGVTPEQIVVEE